MGRVVGNVGKPDRTTIRVVSCPHNKRIELKLLSMGMYTLPAYEVNPKQYKIQSYINRFKSND